MRLLARDAVIRGRGVFGPVLTRNAQHERRECCYHRQVWNSQSQGEKKTWMSGYVVRFSIDDRLEVLQSAQPSGERLQMALMNPEMMIIHLKIHCLRDLRSRSLVDILLS